MPKKLDLIGQKYGYLTVVSFSHVDKHGKTVWNCACDCGNKTKVSSNKMRTSNTIACGCKRTRLTHGFSKKNFRPYSIWSGMRQRCNDPNSISFKNYGGRGIKVCKEWDDFAVFWNDMNKGYRDDLTLDRIDVNGNYCPDNCRWASRKEQMLNTRKAAQGGISLVP